ncbi:hypothetical protein BH09MYX1_BH09MYX1_12920 [soil metagenome]
MRLRSFVLGCVVTFGPLAAPLPAFADAAPPQSEADKRVDEGKALFDAGSYDEALSKYLQACALAKTESCARGVALSELKLGRFVEAQRDLKLYLDKFSPSDRKPYEDMLREAWSKTGHLNVKADDGSQIVVDSDEPVGTAPLADDIPVTPGKHTVLAKKKGTSFGHDVDAPAGKSTVVDLRRDDEEDDTAVDPKTAKAKAKTESYRTTGAWVGAGILAGLGVVGIGFGIGAAVVSQSAKDDVKRFYAPGVCAGTSTACNSYRDAVQSMNTAAALSVTGYVTGGILIGTGLLVWLMWPKGERPILVPTVSPSSLGLSLTGTF